MPQRLQAADHLSEAELAERVRTAERPLEQRHWQVIHLVAKGWRTADISEAVGYSPTWIRKLAGRYNEGGPEAMRDGRRDNPGQRPLLDEAGREALKEALENDPPPEGGQWNGPKVAEWIAEYLDRDIAPARGWEYLRRLGYTPQRPRPRHKEADEAAQRAWKRPPAGAGA